MTGTRRKPGELDAGEAPIHLAKRLGIIPDRHTSSYDTVTFDLLLVWACDSYWRRRLQQDRERRQSAA